MCDASGTSCSALLFRMPALIDHQTLLLAGDQIIKKANSFQSHAQMEAEETRSNFCPRWHSIIYFFRSYIDFCLATRKHLVTAAKFRVNWCTLQGAFTQVPQGQWSLTASAWAFDVAPVIRKQKALDVIVVVITPCGNDTSIIIKNKLTDLYATVAVCPYVIAL